MSPFFVSCLWCVLQISLLCAVGVVLSLLIVRRWPASSAAVISATAGAILVATALVPIQIPHWALPRASVAEANMETPMLPSAGASEADKNADSSNTFLVDFRALFSEMRTAIHPGTTIDQTPSLAVWCVTTVVALGILVGMLRLCGAFFAVWQIRRGSISIDDELADLELRALARMMKCRLPVGVAASAEVESAAVIGWLRPLVVLPTDWKTWPVEQLRTVLAHELAHIVRRDYLWRAVGTIARAIHYYHPLAHWLLRRLAYSQEVAADQLAARTLGSRTKYLKELSQLAIRQDDHMWFRAEPILLPTSSSHLIRRIKMLRTKERTQNRAVNLVVRTVAVSAVVLLAVATTALRGLAEPANEQPTTPTAQIEGVQSSTAEMFKYLPIDPAIIGDNEHGIFVLRVGELLKRESIKPMVRRLNESASAMCQSISGSSELAEINLEMIDYVVGQAQVGIMRLQRTPENQRNGQLTLGSNYWIVRFSHDISSWQEWIQRYVPAAEKLQHGEITYFRFPAIPAFGAAGILVAARDSHTLVFAEDDEHFWEQVEANNTVDARWTNEWKELDGGLFSILATDKSIETSFDEPRPAKAMALNQIFDNVQQLGYGIDWNAPASQMSLKMLFSCASREEAELVATGIDSVMSLSLAEAKAELEKDGQIDPAAKVARANLHSELLKNYETQTTTKPDGTAVVRLKTSFTLPLEEMLREFMSEEVASREPASGAVK